MLLLYSVLCCPHHLLPSFFFFFNYPPTTEIYTLSLHDALPISSAPTVEHVAAVYEKLVGETGAGLITQADRKSTRLNSSHRCISYAVFCLKKKNEKKNKLSVRNDPCILPATNSLNCLTIASAAL